MGLLLWMLIGLIAGAIARALVPGPQRLGVLMTMVLGLVGSLVGGLLSTLLFRSPWNAEIRPSGLIFSTIGAIIVLAISARIRRTPW